MCCQHCILEDKGRGFQSVDVYIFIRFPKYSLRGSDLLDESTPCIDNVPKHFIIFVSIFNKKGRGGSKISKKWVYVFYGCSKINVVYRKLISTNTISLQIENGLSRLGSLVTFVTNEIIVIKFGLL